MTYDDLDLIALRSIKMSDIQHLGVMGAGGPIGGLILRSTATLNCSLYFVGLGSIAVLLGSAGGWWVVWGWALLPGHSYLPALAEAATTVLVGMFLCWLGKARSRDVNGDARQAWMAFLPLWGVGVGLMALGRVMGVMIGDQIEARALTDMQHPAIAPAYDALMQRSPAVQAELDKVIANTTPPILIGNGLIITRLSREKLHLTYQITCEKAAPGAADPVTAQDLVTRFCEVHARQIDHGASVTLTFSGKDSPLAAPLGLTAATCTL